MTLTRQILRHIKENGPVSAPVLAEILEAPKDTVSRLITRLHRDRKQLYIIRFERDERNRTRAVYNAGARKDATRPKPDERAKKQRWYAKRKALSTMNSVFNLGIPATNWNASCKLSHSSGSQA